MLAEYIVDGFPNSHSAYHHGFLEEDRKEHVRIVEHRSKPSLHRRT